MVIAISMGRFESISKAPCSEGANESTAKKPRTE
jgi:hypothetical protein